MIRRSPFVQISDLTVEFRSGDAAVRPLDQFSVDIEAGSLALLLGPSGCGKTTLLSCLGGILAPTSGTVNVEGIDVGALQRAGNGRELTRYRRHQVGIVFQAFNLIASMTTLENVMVPLTAAGRSNRDAQEVARRHLDRVGLANRLDHRPGELSGGQQQRVAIARAIALEPPLILADEPTAHLDYVQVEGILRLLRSLADDGRTIVVSTHDDRLLPLADQVVEMQPNFASGQIQPVERITVPAGHWIFEQGAISDFIYVIEEGEVAIFRNTLDGPPDRLNELHAGDHFGEMGPLFGLRRSASAWAVTDTVLTALTPPTFREWLGDDSRLSAVIAGRR